MDNIYYVYALLDPRKKGKYTYNGLGISFLYEPFYIGKGKRNRKNHHLKDCLLEDGSHKSNKILIIRKTLNKNPYIIKCEENLIEELSFAWEMNYIKTIGRYDLKLGFLTNMTDGGDGSSGRECKEETKNKISKSNTGKHHSEETKKKISMAVIGEKHPNYGNPKNYHPTEETRQKVSKLHKGKFVSISTREKISRSKQGNKHPMFGKKGKDNPRFGQHHSEETINKMKENKIGEKHPQSKIWFVISPEGIKVGPILDMVKFCKENKLNYSCMSNAATGLRSPVHKGWKIYKVYTKKEYIAII